MARRERGVTLLEIMVVISIMAILLAIGTGQYRRMQANNTFNNEVERLGTELRNAGILAQATGLLQPVVSPGTARPEDLSKNRSGVFLWQTWRDGKVVAQGKLGSQGTVRLDFNTNFTYTNTKFNPGVYLTLTPLDPETHVPLGAPVLQVVYTPSGTPLSSGRIVCSYLGRPMTIKLSSLGDIEGPNE
ncbi:MAG: prepilin-type N-terminal cleavage/methylation domain-containing protein [Burkholderiales bacterium]|jgi:prepilin-type N-terminal cleavage/methylation domain-containing protein|nr:prepilin-type N-terminal cleavage/methylation domain-containing protein [Burkholderiales bacterium]